MRRVVYAISALAFVGFLVASAWLGRLERGGPAHADVTLRGRVPATLFLPQPAREGQAFLDVPAPGERPPVVLLVHGFASDRSGMSSLARRLAGTGAAVLTLDVRGHGANRNPFRRSFAQGDTFHEDLAAAVDFLRSYPHVDASRLVVMGHSMGAGATLDYATRDPAVDGAVLISGGWKLEGPYRPRNALFLYAAGDPPRIKSRVTEIARKLVDEDQLFLEKTYGAIEAGTAVRIAEVSGADHATIVWTDEAVREIADWVHAIFGTRAPETLPEDPRTRAVLAVLGALLLALPGLGLVVARIVPEQPAEPGAARGALGLLVVGAALLGLLPLSATGTPGPVLSVEVGDVVATHLFLAGVVLLVAMGLWRPGELRALVRDPLPTLLGAAVGVVAIYLLLNPIGVLVHRLTLTPERLVVFGGVWLAVLPFAAGFQVWVRRGGTPVATTWAVLGRGLVLASLVAGARAEIVPGVVMLMVPALLVVYALFEVLAAALYAGSRNRAAIALIDSGWLALVIAASMPVRI